MKWKSEPATTLPVRDMLYIETESSEMACKIEQDTVKPELDVLTFRICLCVLAPGETREASKRMWPRYAIKKARRRLDEFERQIDEGGL